MQIDHLIQMANRIGDFFGAMPDEAEAVEGIAQHLRRFWEPRMRQQLLDHVAQAGPQGLQPVVARALQRLVALG